MLKNICRLCLSDNNLGPIFVNSAKSENYSAILALTTGLKIEPNDGYPQKICSRCTELVDSALTLRNQCHLAHTKLLQLNLDENAMKVENNPTTSCESNQNINLKDFETNSIEDCEDNSRFTEFEIEIQCDRISEEQNSKQNGGVEKLSRKKVTETYMGMVDGDFNPKGPVKCKVCKKILSNWKCFVEHARLHLQGKKVICEVHSRRMHTGERPYVCDSCAAAYHSRKCLVQHIESHRDTATVQCEQCPQKFKSARYLARHRHNAHARIKRTL